MEDRMSHLSGLVLALMLALVLAGGSRAATLAWEGSSRISLVTSLNKATVFPGTGVATVNGSGGLGALTKLAQAGGVKTTTATMPPFDYPTPHGGGIWGTTTLPLTDPENSTLISLIGTAHLGGGTFTGISGGAINGNATRPVPGRAKVCILLPGCGSYIPVPFSKNNGATGIGVGGTVTANTFSNGPGLKVSVIGRPWTIGVSSVADVETKGHVESGTTFTTGFIHGPASNTNSAAQASGVVQYVTASVVLTSLDPPNDRQAQVAFARFKFIPEPGLLLLLGSGITGLLLLGRSRMRR
jgi:hypothetical protein